MEPVLSLRNINKSFGKRRIISDLSFDVYPGEVFGFLGPNGAGKTTTIKMVMGFLGIDSGDVIIDGINIRKDYEKAMSRIGGIVENPEMYKNLPGRVNLEMYARLHGKLDRARIDEVTDLVGMSARINDKVKKYSLGMKQRVGLAQALVHRPKVLILDEPTNGLDPSGIRELRDIFKHLAHQEGVAVIVSSHMLSEMELMCDRVAIIDRGTLLGVKAMEELKTQASGGVIYRIETPDGEKAAQLLEPDFAGCMRQITAEFIEVAITREQVPAVVAALTRGGVSIYGIARSEASLEDAFLNILNVTKGGDSIA